MKISIITKGFIFFGLIEILFSFIWFSKWYDLSQAVLFIGGGCFILILAGVFESIKRNQQRIVDLEKTIQEMKAVITEHERKLSG
ncbi:MAG: hypothetical protein WC346_04595 [Methanogenium sp.]|jgi:hypothetical protein